MEPHIRDAIAELDQAERALDEIVPGRPSASPSTPITPAPPAAGADKKKETTAPRAAPRSSGPTGSTSCGPACEALASMQRAAEHLCRLTGQQDARCEKATARLRAATDRVSASCGSCGPSNELRG